MKYIHDVEIENHAARACCIEQILSHGESAAMSAKYLCDRLGLSDTRVLRKMVEREREAGALILSSNSGYYLPDLDADTGKAEIKRFARRCDARMLSNRIAVKAAKAMLKAYGDTEIAGQAVLFEDVSHETH